MLVAFSQGKLGRRKGSSLRTAFALSLVAALFAQTLVALAAPGEAPAAQVAPIAASYNAAPPATMGAGSDAQVQVTLTNTGSETWKPWAPPAASPALGEIAVSYHWYTPAGEILVWDGVRSSIGAGDVAPGATRSAPATVRAPSLPGSYLLRFAVIKEGVAWAAPSQSFAVQVNPAYSASFVQPAAHALLLGKSYTLPITFKNTGTATWTKGAINLSYHWHDAAGRVVRWDGERTPLAADVAPGAGATVQLAFTAPATAGTYRLTVDLVREGVGWFADFGGTVPATASIVVAPITYAAGYGTSASANAYTGQAKTVAITVFNTGNVPWGTTLGSDVVNLSYHIRDAAGRVVVWDGQRTVLGPMDVGASKTVQMAYTAPAALGDYTLTIDAVREGVAWLSTAGSTPIVMAMKVDSGYTVGFGISTTPQQATIGARIPIRLNIDNYGPRPLEAGGPNPHRLSYHIYSASGELVAWDGLRGLLPFDVATGRSASVDIDVQLPSRVGEYRIKWDIVHEGVAWLSGYGNAMKEEPISVQPGVTFFGKGFGHGLGMSQWGAQGMATGAAGAPATGEQIVAHYYPGTVLASIDPGNPNQQIRVLLSTPSSAGKHSCGMAVLNGGPVDVESAKGFRVLNEAPGGGEVFVAGPFTPVRFEISGNLINVSDISGGVIRPVFSGPGPLLTVPIDPAAPTNIIQKGFYRGTFRFTNITSGLRTVNIVDYDDYLKGVVPLEMLRDWHLEAYRAQAIAARSYAYFSWRGLGAEYDVLDDQSDQCYGGVKTRSGRVIETDITNLAVTTTAKKVLTYNGVVIKAYFSSSSGGHTKPEGCWSFNVIIHPDGSVTCRPSPQYLSGVADPGDINVSVPERNRQASWQVTFTSDQIRAAIIRYRGVDIGPLQSVDLSNRVPAVVGHVVSVKVVGQFMTLDLPADRLLRDHLFLKSTMVRLAPW